MNIYIAKLSQSWGKKTGFSLSYLLKRWLSTLIFELALKSSGISITGIWMWLSSFIWKKITGRKLFNNARLQNNLNIWGISKIALYLLYRRLLDLLQMNKSERFLIYRELSAVQGLFLKMCCTDGLLPRNNFLSLTTAAVKNRAVCANRVSITYWPDCPLPFLSFLNNSVHDKWFFMGISTCMTKLVSCLTEKGAYLSKDNQNLVHMSICPTRWNPTWLFDTPFPSLEHTTHTMTCCLYAESYFCAPSCASICPCCIRGCPLVD